MQVSLDEPFAPPGESWVPVSPRLRTLRRTILFAVSLPLAALAAGAAGVFLGWWAALGTATVAVFAVVWGWWLIDRNYASWGYAEREDDLLVAHGWMFRRLVVVPYGRMQFVDVTAGPVERKFGLATLQLHTAAAATDATIPGLPPDEAARLRDRLAALGEARSAGL
jgi:membrane protein YdbS with pleckstrin-like domain